jgi:hypothetical protein
MPYHDRACCLQSGHSHGIGFGSGSLGKHNRACGGGLTGNIEQVLDRDW